MLTSSTTRLDNGETMKTKAFKNMMEELGVKHRCTGVYHQQSNLVERWHRTLLAALKKFSPDKQRTWPELLPGLLKAYRTQPHSSTGQPPWTMLRGKVPGLDGASVLDQYNAQADTQVDIEAHQILEDAHKDADKMLERTTASRKRQYDKDRKEVGSMKGVRVWRYQQSRLLTGDPKYERPYVGPYRCLEDVKSNNILIRRCDDTQDHNLIIPLDQSRHCRKEITNTMIWNGEQYIKIKPIPLSVAGQIEIDPKWLEYPSETSLKKIKYDQEPWDPEGIRMVDASPQEIAAPTTPDEVEVVDAGLQDTAAPTTTGEM